MEKTNVKEKPKKENWTYFILQQSLILVQLQQNHQQLLNMMTNAKKLP